MKLNIYNKIKAYICMKIGKLNKEQGVIIARNLYRKKIEKKYKNKFIDERNLGFIHKENKTVWVCWFQGLNNAPTLVKKCIESIKDHFKDFKIVIITLENYKEYVVLPEYIIGLFNNGKIPFAQFSDLIRLNLLINYGGLWIDSTVFCTNKIEDDFLRFPFFAFSHNGQHDDSISIGNWFMWSYSNDLLLRSTYNFLLEYWKKEKKLKEYFIMQIFYTMSEQLYQMNGSNPFYSDLQAHYLSNVLNDKFDQKLYDFIVSKCNFHKLSYKIFIDENEKDSFYFKLN